MKLFKDPNPPVVIEFTADEARLLHEIAMHEITIPSALTDNFAHQTALSSFLKKLNDLLRGF